MAKEVAIFAAGCFWGVQFYFDQVPGVVSTEAGYIGGTTKNPTYEQVSAHGTGHAEAVKITYDTRKVVEGTKAIAMQGAGEQRSKAYEKYGERAAEPATQQSLASHSGVSSSAGQQAEAFRILLKHFFRMHDPTQLNRQGPDVGDQYRSAIFYTSDEQKAIAEKTIKQLGRSNIFTDQIVTTVEKAEHFWPAEAYHQKYTERTGLGMCHVGYEST